MGLIQRNLLRCNRNRKIASYVAPYAMDVAGWIASGIGLRVHEFDEERWALDSIVVTDAWFVGPGPGEIHFVVPGLFDLIEALLTNIY